MQRTWLLLEDEPLLAKISAAAEELSNPSACRILLIAPGMVN